MAMVVIGKFVGVVVSFSAMAPSVVVNMNRANCDGEFGLERGSSAGHVVLLPVTIIGTLGARAILGT
jgi:hypothetical protein